ALAELLPGAPGLLARVRCAAHEDHEERHGHGRQAHCPAESTHDAHRWRPVSSSRARISRSHSSWPAWRAGFILLLNTKKLGSGPCSHSSVTTCVPVLVARIIQR